MHSNSKELPTPDIRYEILEGKAGLARALALRMEVFVREQRVPEEIERDEYDDAAIHALAWAGGDVVATGRLILEQDRARIGRMAVAKPMRGHGLGRAILDRLVAEAKRRGAAVATLHAQCHAAEFYRRAGFREHGPVFQEAGIDHVEMEKQL